MIELLVNKSTLFCIQSMLWYCMLSNSRRNHGFDVALRGGQRTMGTVFLTADAADHSRTQHVAKEFSETLLTSEDDL